MQEKLHPRALARRKAMLKVATELFLEKGFERTSLTEIIERSKGSRTTLYALFGGKEGLLQAMVEEITLKVWEAISFGDPSAPLTEDELTKVGCRFVTAVCQPDSVAMFRIIVSEGTRVPNISRLFFDSGPEQLRHQLGNWFGKAIAAHGLDSERGDYLANMFVGIILSDFHLRSALNLTDAWPEDEIEDYVRAAVRVFLKGSGLSRIAA